MGSVTSALTRTRNALVKVGSEPENHDPERSQSAPESDRAKKKNSRFNVSSQTGRQGSGRPSLSEVLSRQDSDGVRQTSRKKTPEGPQTVANEDAESSNRPQASFARSKSQSALWNAITAGMGIKGKEQKAPLNDPRSPEEILADELPAADEPDATEKTAIRFAARCFRFIVNYNEVAPVCALQQDIDSRVQLIIPQASFAYS
ncbi:Calcium/calmodulin-dependent 3'%2C5'-cyclic nucleotide phosphodiesterase 1C [Xyrichtys novacula]|uniref:Calcium/calmodulin-dependent 3',5'-cyclic nucleotide phosphodiesterase 1C n=1 Tax=Xyrichtys novacula TaxID=13765 RepID=A0AAV1GFD0_XYRNO|nr:Calcium/calmodulin-dependent 3'%2C5'-cyclic nucleotide phosphodiesterase 1C [Xyrichtys novacula]